MADLSTSVPPTDPDGAAERRRSLPERVERHLPLLLALVPLGLALLPNQTPLLRVVWVMFAITLAMAFGALTERRKRTQKLLSSAFAVAVIAFGVLAGLSLRESRNTTFAALEPAQLEADVTTSTFAPSAPIEASVEGASTTAEQDLAACQQALRAIGRTIAPLVTPAAPEPAPPAEDARSIADRRAQCESLLTVIDTAVRRAGAADPSIDGTR